MLHLVTFGGLALESVNEAVVPRLSAQRLAILAVLAAEGDRRVSRERLTGLFWPDADEERARHSLRQALYTLRQEIGYDLVRSDFVLSLDPSAITSDVASFRAALARGDRPAAGKLVRGPFLQGFYLPSAAPFQRWAEEERARLHTVATTAIAALATEAAVTNDLDTAVAWWRQLAELDPLSGRFALGYLNALAARGDRAEALAFARAHEALVRRELEAEPDPEIRRLEARLRSMSSPTTEQPPSEGTSSASGQNVATGATSGGPVRLSRASVGAIASGERARRLLQVGAALVIVVTVAGFVMRGGWSFADPPAAATASTTDGIPPDVGTRSPTAYRLYQEGLRTSYSGNNKEAAQRLMRAALHDDSTFAMAAYYDAMLTDDGPDFTLENRALRLAARAPDRVRLLITADMLHTMQSPDAVAASESLGLRYPDDIPALEAVSRTRFAVGDWPGAARALEHAIELDSAATDDGRAPCHLCLDLEALANIYYWSDSLPAAERVAQRYIRMHPESSRGWDILTWVAVKSGDSLAATRAQRRNTELYPAARNAPQEVRYKLLLDHYETTLSDLRPLLESPRLDDVGPARWWLLISLRNQGRLRDAKAFNETGQLPGLTPLVTPQTPDEYNSALVSLESGDAAAAVAAFTRQRRSIDTRAWAPGFAARQLAWNGTLLGMSLAAAGDTAALIRMVDTVQYWGARSLFGRDGKMHHYLRGMVFVARGRDDEAIHEFEQAIFSTTLGFTRVNYEMGQALLRRNRPREAVAIIAPALRGEIDAANLYVTRTELHELLARAHDMMGATDSAAVHYRAVVRAWSKADPAFHARRDAARAWLARYGARKESTRSHGAPR